MLHSPKTRPYGRYSPSSDSVSGKPLGVTFLGMSCTIAALVLDGLCRKHSLKTK